MFNVFKGTVLSLSREKAIFIWALAFPLILSTIFMFMFSRLDDAGAFEPIDTVIVADENYAAAPEFRVLIETLSSSGDDQMLAVQTVPTKQDAIDLMNGEGGSGSGYQNIENDSIAGFFLLDEDGTPTLYAPSGLSPDSLASVNSSILKTLADGYVRNRTLMENIARTNPAALADTAAIEDLFEGGDATEQIAVTHDPPKQSVRYYFALLGMSALFAGQIGLIAISRTQPNLSALGARRALGGTSRTKTLFATLLASWMLSFACLLIAYSYIRFIVGVDFGGRDAACIAVIATSSLLATAFGTLIGALPKIEEGVKGGLLAGIVSLASLFAGLYGQPTMELADTINTVAPVAQYINPATQIAQAFYSITYYDTFAPTGQSIAVLLAMTAVLFAVAALFIRRQRYASL